MEHKNKPGIEVCLSPALLHLYNVKEAVVVIIDIFRATSTITTALHNGAKCVIPVATIEECISTGASIQGSITAGERDGKVIDGLQYGNSPSEYTPEFINGKTLVLTTTNGTRLLHMVTGADEIVIGSFFNLRQLCQYLASGGKNVLLACASWKDRFNLEDTLFAGAVINELHTDFIVNDDSARAALYLHEQSKGDYINFLKNSSHYKRLSAYGLEDEMAYCLTPDLYPVVPVLKGIEIVKSNQGLN